MASAYTDDDIKRMTVAQLSSFLTDRKITLPAGREKKQTYVDLALGELRKERAGIKLPPESEAASRMQSPQTTGAKRPYADVAAERPLGDESDAVEPSRELNGDEPPVVLLPLPTPPPTAFTAVAKGLVFAVGIALIAVVMAYIFRFVYDQPEPEPATYWDIAHAKILEILHLIEKRYIEPVAQSLGLSTS